MAREAKVMPIGGDVPTNGGKFTIDKSIPYVSEVKIKGVADFLFRRWNCEDVKEKRESGMGSAARKTDNVAAYVYRNEENELCVPGEYLRMAIINAAKFRRDPRSPRKSATDLYKAAIVPLTTLASFGKGKVEWDYLDQRRAVVNHGGINRVRPALRAGWEATFHMMVNLPEYISPEVFNDVIQAAGRLVGLGDFRPTYGRFQVVSYKVLEQ